MSVVGPLCGEKWEKWGYEEVGEVEMGVMSVVGTLCEIN